MLLDICDNQKIIKPYFRYVLPHTLLKSVSAYNILFPDKYMLSKNYALIPDASGTLSFAYDGKNIKGELWGTATCAKVIGSEANNYKFLLLIELRPGGLHQLTGVNQRELTDLRIDLDHVNRELNKSISDSLEQAGDIEDLVHRLDLVLLSQMGKVEKTNNMLGAVQQIVRQNGLFTVKELSMIQHYSERHMNRLFYEQVGVNLKLFLRIVRMNKAITQLHNPNCNMAMLAQQFGFYDQSHFISEFKALCGVVPSIYIENMSDFSYESL
jgi:AraC-like DNA-binding protein